MIFVTHDAVLRKYAKIAFNFSPNSLYFVFFAPLILEPFSQKVTGKPVMMNLRNLGTTCSRANLYAISLGRANLYDFLVYATSLNNFLAY